MTSRCKPTLFLLLLACAALSPAAAPATRARGDDAAQADPSVTEARAAIERLAAKLEDVQLLRGTYVQTQESLLLAEPIVTRGRIHVRKEPGCLLLDVEQPHRVRIRSDATTHQIHHLEKHRAERWVFESNEATKALLQCFTSDVRLLERTFEIQGSRRVDKQLEIMLAPRDKEVRRLLTSLRLTVRDEDGLITRVAHTNPEGEEVRIDVTKLELDPELDPKGPTLAELFDPELPQGVKLMVHRVE